MAAYPPETYDRRDDLKAHYIYEEHMHALEQAEEEKDRIEEDALLAAEEECQTCFGHGGCADCMNEDDIRFDDCAVPIC